MKRDIIVIGGSAGSVKALLTVINSFPSDMPAAVFVVIHMPDWYESQLPLIINRPGRMEARMARHEERIEHGRVYIAPSDKHMLLDDEHIHLWHGPKENMHRPAINALFRSAAVTYRERVAGVILSGTLDDGSAGLWWVKRYMGLAIVQDPNDAEFPDMPRNALRYIDVDDVGNAEAIGRLLVKIVSGKQAKDVEVG